MPFSSGRTEVVTTYGYSDIATGRSIVNHYGGMTSGAYILSKNPFWSDGITTSGGGPISFDLEFTRPRTIEGEMIVNVSDAIDSAASKDVWCTMTVQKISGGSTTTLKGPEMSKKWVSPVGAAANFVTHAFMLHFDIVKTVFRKDDVLRVIAQITYSGGGVNNYIGHDPKNREWDKTIHVNSEDSPTQMLVQIPFRLDV